MSPALNMTCPAGECQSLGAEAKELLHRRLDLGEDGNCLFHFLFEAHPVFLFGSANAPCSTSRPRSITSTISKRSANSGRDSTTPPSCLCARAARSRPHAAASSDRAPRRPGRKRALPRRTERAPSRPSAGRHGEARAAHANLVIETVLYHHQAQIELLEHPRTSRVMRSVAPAWPVTILPKRTLSCSVAAPL